MARSAAVAQKVEETKKPGKSRQNNLVNLGERFWSSITELACELAKITCLPKHQNDEIRKSIAELAKSDDKNYQPFIEGMGKLTNQILTTTLKTQQVLSALDLAVDNHYTNAFADKSPIAGDSYLLEAIGEVISFLPRNSMSSTKLISYLSMLYYYYSSSNLLCESDGAVGCCGNLTFENKLASVMRSLSNMIYMSKFALQLDEALHNVFGVKDVSFMPCHVNLKRLLKLYLGCLALYYISGGGKSTAVVDARVVDCALEDTVNNVLDVINNAYGQALWSVFDSMENVSVDNNKDDTQNSNTNGDMQTNS